MLALQKAAKGKRKNRMVCKVEERPEYFLNKLRVKLLDGTYETAPYKSKIVYEPKRRVIHKLPFYPDRIVHHAIVNVMGDYWDSLFIHDSYACRKGKGQHAGSAACMPMVRRNKYVLKCDVSKFYHSIDHDTLKYIIRNKLKDKMLLALLDEVIDSSRTCDILKPGQGVPIGNLVSQWFGNLYMNEFDMFIKHKCRVKDYVRYCDDFVLFDNDKSRLRELDRALAEFLGSSLKLNLSKHELYPTSHGVDFLGYRHFDNYILVRKSTAKRIMKRMNLIRAKLNAGCTDYDRYLGQVDSALGWLKWANTYNLRMFTDIHNLRSFIYGKRKDSKIQ